MSYLDVKLNYITNRLDGDYSRGPGSELLFHCPRCPELGKRNDDKKLYVNIDTGLYWCHRCEFKGRFTFGQHMKDFKSIDIQKDIYEFFSDEEEEEEFVYKEIPKERLIDHQYSEGYKYMRSRGFTDQMIVDADMRVDLSLSAGQLFGRVVIPNEVTYKIFSDIYVARSYIGSVPKYLYPPESNKSKVVYNLHNIEEGIDSLYINEGALDSIIVGLDKSVAIYGKHCSNNQIQQLVDIKAKKYYVSLDTDAYDQAVSLCERLYERVNSDVEIYLVELLEDKDAVDIGRDAYLRIAEQTDKYVPKRFQSILNYFED